MFSCLVEVLAHEQWRVHPCVDASVDALLAGWQPHTQLRTRHNGQMIVRFGSAAADLTHPDSKVDETEPCWLTSLGKLATHMRAT